MRPRWIWRGFSYQGGDDLTFRTKTESAHFFETKMEMPRFSRPRRRRPDQESIPCAHGGYSATLAIRMEMAHTKVNTVRISRPGRRGRDQENIPCDRGGYGATLAIRVEMAHTKVDTARISRPSRRRRNEESNSRDQGGDAASFQTKAEMARLFRTGWRGRYFPDQRGDGAIFQTKTETARPSRPRRRQRDQEKIPRDCDGYGATFHTRVQTASFS